MSASPLVFMYNLVDRELGNIFVDASGSPLPGQSNARLYSPLMLMYKESH